MSYPIGLTDQTGNLPYVEPDDEETQPLGFDEVVAGALQANYGSQPGFTEAAPGHA